MLIEGLAKICGGQWALKERSLTSRNKVIRRLSTFLYSKSMQAKGAMIGIDAHFGTPPFFPHGPYGVFISHGARIGRNCIIFQHVMIASNTLIDSPRLGAPTIGDNCYIGVGAKIIGNVTIGRNVRIGANAVVTNDVPDFSIVSAGEQKVVSWDDRMDNRFYHKYNGCWRYLENGIWHQVEDPDDLELFNSRFS